MNSSITIEPLLRPAIIRYSDPYEKVLVHVGHMATPGHFLCEYENGDIDEVSVEFLSFNDSEKYFNMFHWE